jgi:DNA-binding CsgD family transcriptional regulator/transcriptional regulator with XRE-family HTH domain
VLPEVLDWVVELRVIWAAAGLSMNEFASVHPVDKGTISRYLNGQRVPRDRWFLDKLLAIQADIGRPVTPAVREHLSGLHLRALEAAHPHEYRVRLVSDELEIALTSRLEAERYARALEQQLAERNRQVQELADDKGRLRAAWDADRVAIQAEYERLTQEIDKVTRQLILARRREAQASRRCQHLEGLLDHLDILPTAEDERTGMRFPGDAPDAAPDAAARQRPDSLAALKPLELRVLSLIAEGRSNRGIANHLNYSPRTIEVCFTRIVAKLGLAATGGSDQTDTNRRVLATLEFLAATSRSARPGSTSSSSISVRTSRAAGELASPGGVEDRLDRQADVAVIDAGDGVRARSADRNTRHGLQRNPRTVGRP